MYRSNVLRLACCVLALAIGLGQTKKKVYLKSGGPLEGMVTETDDAYRIELAGGGVVVLPKNQVVAVEDLITDQDLYTQRLAKIDAKDPKAHFDLATWAYERNLLDIAKNELETALKLNPRYEMAALLLEQVDAKLQAKKLPTQPTVGPAPVMLPVMAGAVEANWLCTDEEISRIRLEELRANDRVVVEFRSDVVNRFIDMMLGRGDFASPGFITTFRRYPPVRKVTYILDNIDRNSVSIKDDMFIKSDPRFMTDFRRQVWPTIAARCASADCHGGERPLGGFRLLNIPTTDVKVEYTNFLILDTFTSQGRKMIDRDHHDLSLLLQYGLPPEQAQWPHRVPTTPAYLSRNAADYRRVLEWIESLAGPPHPDYRVQLRVPWAPKGSTGGLPALPLWPRQPATQPAGEAQCDNHPHPGSIA